MRAAVFRRPGVVEVTDVPVPVPGPGDLLVKVRAASVCGTDLRITKHGHFRIPEGTSRVLGHELTGEVVEAGVDVVGLVVGDRISVAPNIGCGRCAMCARGLNQLCPDYEAFGITIDGGFAEYLLVPAIALERGNVFHVPDALTDEVAAILEPMSCCLHGQRAIGVSAADSVLIIGAGPIGCLHTALAKRAGARQVIVANTRQPRLDIAGRMGADELINVSETDLLDEVMRLTGGRGADVVITCVSKSEVIASATDMAGRLGRINVFSGLGDQARPQIDVNSLHYREQILTGTTGSSVADYGDVIDIVADGGIDLSPIITSRFAIDDISQAMEASRSGQGMKSVIVFEEAAR
ncbi:zinc-dependent dehydrogenase [Herbiconiux sp. CPCC 203407]|uniref:Zinc-dependent dehydrogenase n=1 Tax=Herbiconiux oxytropis TaxID=2970915 RepID=A0AA42BV03_9MICO|nr:zinc-dependent dehydrogenase [Herbiconiux oxytropis]MCS5723666.1 zinc-dependent dehydrogenase [Herbiconiux oxytropis]MCS5728075.1 zinc-dependent dehydrogenase [Herbiconiux oxytropis]